MNIKAFSNFLKSCSPLNYISFPILTIRLWLPLSWSLTGVKGLTEFSLLLLSFFSHKFVTLCLLIVRSFGGFPLANCCMVNKFNTCFLPTAFRI